MQKKIKFIGKVVGIVALLYGFVCVVFYVNQDKFIFQAETLPQNYPFAFDKKFTEYFIPTMDGHQLIENLRKQYKTHRCVLDMETGFLNNINKK